MRTIEQTVLDAIRRSIHMDETVHLTLEGTSDDVLDAVYTVAEEWDTAWIGDVLDVWGETADEDTFRLAVTFVN